MKGRRGGLACPRLMLIVGSRPSRFGLTELAEAAVAGGVDAIQVRLPDASAERLRVVAGEIRRCFVGDAALLVNGVAAIEVAAELGAEGRTRGGRDERRFAPREGAGSSPPRRIGVHLRERDGVEAIGVARRRLGAGAVVGRSVHSPEAAIGSSGADFVLAGHVYPSASHPGTEPLGLHGLAAIVGAAPCPVVAVGGIEATNAAAAIRVGAVAVAAIGAIAGAADPERAARVLRAAVDAALEEQLESTTRTGTIEVTINGKPFELAAGWTVRDFLASRQLADGMALVELNGTIVPRPRYAETVLHQGDALEVVHAVGGG